MSLRLFVGCKEHTEIQLDVLMIGPFIVLYYSRRSEIPKKTTRTFLLNFQEQK